MKEIIKNYIINIMIDKNNSLNKQVKYINNFIDKINKLNIPNNPIKIYGIKLINIEFIIGYIRHDNYSIYEPLENIATEIAEIIEYNEDIKLFKKSN